MLIVYMREDGYCYVLVVIEIGPFEACYGVAYRVSLKLVEQ